MKLIADELDEFLLWQMSYAVLFVLNLDQKLDFKIDKPKGIVRTSYILNFTMPFWFSAYADHSFS